MKRADPIARVCRLVTALLEKRELTWEEAAAAMDVKRHRAREIVEECRAHIPWLEMGRRGRRDVLRARGVGKTDATIEVAIAACFGTSVASLFEGTRYADGMRTALEYVVATSPNPARFVDLERKFVFLSGGGEVSLQRRVVLLERVAKAVLERQALVLDYQSFDSVAPRTERAEPWAIAIHKNQLYLLGRSVERDAEWVWRFARINGVRTLKRPAFECPGIDRFDPRTLFAESFGIWLQPEKRPEVVEVLLDPRWRAYATAHRWHRSQAPPSVDARGRIRIRMTVKTCGELKQWILSFGSDAEVLTPPALRDEIGEELRKAAAQYPASTRRASSPRC